MRRREAGRGAAPAGLAQRGTRAASGLPPGTTRSPCQELADVSRRKSFPTLELKRGPLPETSAIGAPRGARVPQGTSHKDLRFLGVPSPLIPRTR